MAEKKNLKDFAKETVLIAAAVAALTAEETAAQVQQDNLNIRKNRLELFKGRVDANSITALIKNKQYDAAYNLSFDPSKQGAIKNNYQDNINYIRDEIEDLSLDQVLDSINKNPEIKEFLKSLDKENFYMNSLENGKYKNIKDVIDNTYVQEVDIKFGSTSTMAEYSTGDKSIARNVFQKDPNKIYTKEEEYKIDELLEFMKDKEFIGSLIAHELDHKKTAEENVNNYEYTMVNGVQFFDTSLDDWDRVQQAKEISAEINAMIYFSERYQETGIVSKAMIKRFPDYADAIKNGLINPKSNNPEDNEKEIKLMCSIAQNDWDNERKEKYSPNIYEETKEYARFISDEQSENTNGKANIRKESVPITANRKMQNTFTFIYKGEKKNFLKHINLNRIEPYENTKFIKANFYNKIDKFNEHFQKKAKTYDAASHFMGNNEER